jgi:beta-mannosidase
VVRLGQDLAAESEVKTGLRSLELRRVPDQWGKSFEFVVNGVPSFCQGSQRDSIRQLPESRDT